jgi:hypothetical protein
MGWCMREPYCPLSSAQAVRTQLVGGLLADLLQDVRVTCVDLNRTASQLVDNLPQS